MRLGTIAASFALAWSAFAVTLLTFASARGGTYMLVPYKWPAWSESILLLVCYTLTAIACGRYALIVLQSPYAKFVIAAAALVALCAVSLVLWPAFPYYTDDVVKFVRMEVSQRLIVSLIPLTLVAGVFAYIRAGGTRLNLSAEARVESATATSPILQYWHGPHGYQTPVRCAAVVIVISASLGAAIRLFGSPISGVPSDALLGAHILFFISIPLIVLGSAASAVARSSKTLAWALRTVTVAAAGVVIAVT